MQNLSVSPSGSDLKIEQTIDINDNLMQLISDD